MVEFELTNADRASGLWMRLLAHFEDRLTMARHRNDNPLSKVETAQLRGEIRCLKLLMRLDIPRPMTGDL